MDNEDSGQPLEISDCPEKRTRVLILEMFSVTTIPDSIGKTYCLYILILIL